MTVPKYSVLLPTRNRLDLLKDAIETVRRQSFQDWEIVVSDNCSTDDVAGHVRSLADQRIVYIRSDDPLPVTDNWNRALMASSGDHVIMLGDDDGLVPGYFDRLEEVKHQLGDPEMVYHGAYIFSFPNAIAENPRSALTNVTLYQSILCGRNGPALLSRKEAQAVGKAGINLRAHFGFNMQYFLFSRAYIKRAMQYGPFFQGPFPDFYAANLAMLVSDRIGLLPEPMVIIGISPKSYGFYHYNRREKAGISFLLGDQEAKAVSPALLKQLLPGTNMNTSWLISVALIPDKLGKRVDFESSIARYRYLQIMHNLTAGVLRHPSEANLQTLWPHLNIRERLFATCAQIGLAPALLLPQRWAQRWANIYIRLLGQHLPPPKPRPVPVLDRYTSILDVFVGLAREHSHE